jgi:hypothetical protein
MLAKIPLEGNIVQDSYIGNTHILISDAYYINKTPEELERVEANFNQKGLNIYLKYQRDHL